MRSGQARKLRFRAYFACSKSSLLAVLGKREIALEQRQMFSTLRSFSVRDYVSAGLFRGDFPDQIWSSGGDAGHLPASGLTSDEGFHMALVEAQAAYELKSLPPWLKLKLIRRRIVTLCGRSILALLRIAIRIHANYFAFDVAGGKCISSLVTALAKFFRCWSGVALGSIVLLTSPRQTKLWFFESYMSTTNWPV